MAKTLRSRVAAVAVAAVGVAVLQATPAFAAFGGDEDTPFFVAAAEYSDDQAAGGTQDGTNASDEVALSQVAGANNFVEFEAGDDTDAGVPVVTVSGGTIVFKDDAAGSAGTLSTDKTVLTYVDEEITGAIFRVGTPAAGKITVKIALRTFAAGVATDTTLQTFTVTVNSSKVKGIPVASKSKSILNEGDAGAATADETVYADYTAATQAGNIKVTVMDANGVATTKSITASITGPGSLGKSDGNTTYDAASTGRELTQTTTDGIVNFSVWADGTAGVATITITSNDTVIGVEKVTFVGPAKTMTATIKILTNKVGANADAISVKVVDSAGNPVVDGTTVYASSSDEDVATIEADDDTTDGVVKFDVTGEAAGTVTFTFGNAASGATVKTTASVNVTLSVAATVALAFDKATYAPGEKATLKVMLTDANGKPVADDTYEIFGADATSSQLLQGSLPLDGDTVTTVNGIASYTVYMPLIAGPVTVNAKTGTALADVKDAMEGTAVSATADVVVPANADLTAVKAQVATLTTTITSIQTAISTLVASTTATLTVLGGQIAKIMKKLGIK